MHRPADGRRLQPGARLRPDARQRRRSTTSSAQFIVVYTLGPIIGALLAGFARAVLLPGRARRRPGRSRPPARTSSRSPQRHLGRASRRRPRLRRRPSARRAPGPTRRRIRRLRSADAPPRHVLAQPHAVAVADLPVLLQVLRVRDAQGAPLRARRGASSILDRAARRARQGAAGPDRRAAGGQPGRRARAWREYGHEDFTVYVVWTCERALERGLLPHTNLGVLEPRGPGAPARGDRLAGPDARVDLRAPDADRPRRLADQAPGAPPGDDPRRRRAEDPVHERHPRRHRRDRGRAHRVARGARRRCTPSTATSRR